MKDSSSLLLRMKFFICHPERERRIYLFFNTFLMQQLGLFVFWPL